MVVRKPENIEILKKENLYRKFFRVDEYFFKYPMYNGNMSRVVSREVMSRGDAAGILLYDVEHEKMVFVEQMRVGVFIAGENPWILECPAGMMDHQNETPEEVVIREAEEEAGVKVTAIEPITTYFSSPGGISEKLYLFCGRVNAETIPDYAGLDSEDEDIRVVALDVAEVEKMLAENKFNNALTIIAVQWFLLHKDELRKKWG